MTIGKFKYLPPRKRHIKFTIYWPILPEKTIPTELRRVTLIISILYAFPVTYTIQVYTTQNENKRLLQVSQIPIDMVYELSQSYFLKIDFFSTRIR